MDKFELEFNDEHLISIGKITVNFATLEQVVSLFIWNLIEIDEVFAKIITETPSELERGWIKYFISTRDGLERTNGTRLGQIITSELSFRQKIDLLSTIYRIKFNSPTELVEIDTILARTAQAEQKRNAVVHSFWTASTSLSSVDRIKITAKRKDKGLKLVIENLSAKDLEDIANYIAEVAYDIQTLVIRFCASNFGK
ncbi:MAG: hypothetical protein PHU23_00430 [Dehalococcoidales bacterium]|nr:hypothetical protein [Dehalococcoidales bacterium]